MQYFRSNIIDSISFYFLRKKVKENKVEGLIDRTEAYFLYCGALKGPGKGRIVEIGSYFGYSTIFLAAGGKKRGEGKIVAIDPHYGNPEHKAKDREFNSYRQFCQNISNLYLEEFVEAKVMPSEQAVKNWKEPIRLLWIDGNHEYEFVKQDFEVWQPFLVKGGILAFHDANPMSGWPGPQRLVKEIEESKLFKSFNFIHGIAWTQKLDH